MEGMNAPLTESRQRERIRTEVYASADDACRDVAHQIAAAIRARGDAGKMYVLGLATGSTPVRVYRELIRLHQNEGLSFRRVITFNLDEYYGLPREHPESYWRFMHDQLFDHIDVPAEQINIPDGTVARTEVFDWCRRYEEKIAAAGGLDLQLLGIGRTGHIGFNEPGSARDSTTRLVTLDALTRRDAARDFLGEDNVPRYAITMGVGTILSARRIVLLAWGEAKAGIVAQAVEHPPTDALPASFLQDHPDVRCILDTAAASELTRFKHPWLVGPVRWTDPLARRAITWLAGAVQRPFLKLLDEHYAENGMAELITEHGPAYSLNIRVFNQTQHTITGWPGGKPNADDSHRPERAQPHPKRVVVFAPEPSDEMLGMGGTLARLAAQGHDVRVVYLTSGNLAVSDDEAASAAELISEVLRAAEKDGLTVGTERAGTRKLKGLLRRQEARAALRVLGLPSSCARFLDLPFYERGRYRNFHPQPVDVEAIVSILTELRPHQVFATGAAQDPNSVGAICWQLVAKALQRLDSESWIRECRVWLYRSPEKPWAVHEIDMAVPMSPDQLQQKTNAIYQHKTQRSHTPLRSDSSAEAWGEAEHAARQLAIAYDRLGLAEYEAIEGFSRWSFPRTDKIGDAQN
jgi:glucosamine-6-phosphate deaminase